MFARIKKAYATNPILFIHIAAFAIAVMLGIISEILLTVAGIDSIPEPIRDAYMVIFFVAISYWLASASAKRCNAHKHDESKITYIALWLYSRVLRITATIWGISFVITVLSGNL